MAQAQPDEAPSQTHLQRWLQIDPRTKPLIYNQIFASARFITLNYWLEIIFAAAIATFGLVLNSPAVIIGAMLISPLMGPIMATGMALALGDLYLSLKAVANLIVSVAAAIALAAFIVWLLPFHSATSEILARTNPNLLDLGVAVFSGLAGSVIVCRGAGGGGITALPGVAIAVALMPPLCSMGFGFGTGGDMEIVGGAGLLFLTNLVAIISSAFLVFLLVGINSREVCEEMKKAHGDDPLAQRLTHGPLGRTFSNVGQVRWRFLILLVLLASVAWPLRRALMQVAGETVARSVVQEVVTKLAPPNALVSQRMQIGTDNISVRVISTTTIPASQVRRAEQTIADRTGKQANISVEEVASKHELTEILSRLNAAPVAPPPVVPQTTPKTVDELRQEIWARVNPAVSETWPQEAPLQNVELALDPNGIALNVKYQAPKDLDSVALGLVLRDLRGKLQTPNASLVATRVLPLKASRRKR